MLRQSRWLMAAFLIVASLAIVATATSLLTEAQKSSTVSSVLSAYKAQPNEIDPTPFPTSDLSYLTPVPTNTPLPPGLEMPPEDPGPTNPPYEPKPQDPYIKGVDWERLPGFHNDIATTSASTIISGTVAKVDPAQWSTPNGSRPSNPFAADNPYTIYRPVLVAVDSYLKGAQPSTELYLMAGGGTVGQDSVIVPSDDLYTFSKDDHVIVFLNQADVTYGSQPLWWIVEHYTITPGGTAENHYGSMPVDQVLDEIKKALQ